MSAVTRSPSEDQGSKQQDIAISADGVFSVNNQLLPKNDLASLRQIDTQLGFTGEGGRHDKEQQQDKHHVNQ